MKRILPLSLSLISSMLLSGCAEGVAQNFEGGKAVMIEGVEHGVRPLPSGPNVYQAFLNQPTIDDMLGTVNPDVSRRNVLAIEAVTGCKVALTSIQNDQNYTMAAVEC